MPARTPRTPRREVVLDGLIELFLADGFSRFAIEDLAAAMQCSRSTLYEIAPSKEQLIAAVVRAFFRRSTERVEAAVADEPDRTARIGTYLDAISRELAPASPAFYADVAAFAPAREVYSQNTAIAARRVHELVADATGPDSDVDAAFVGAVAAQVMAAIQRGELREMTGLDDASAYRRLADLIVGGVAL